MAFTLVQPPLSVYDIFTTPALTPVTVTLVPVLPLRVAMPLLLLHVPMPPLPVRIVELPPHKAPVPVMLPPDAVTVTILLL